MEPQYSFCTSADGTRLAYAVYGSGPPLVFVNTWVISMDAQFTWPEARAFFDALAARTTLVIYDRRGCGASTREVDDLSIDAEVQDLAAVADAAGLDSFPIFGDAAGGSAVSASFAAAHPERAQRMVFWAPGTSTSQGQADSERASSFRENWSYARRLWAGFLFPDGPVPLQRAASAAFKASVSAEMAARRFESQVDLTMLVPAVRQPVLVLERGAWRARQFATQVAGLMPDARLQFVSGRGATEYPDYEPIVEAVFEFLEVRAAPPEAGSSLPSGTAVILFLDIADSTALTTKLGDDAYRERERELDSDLRKAISDAGGAPVEGKVLGDGIMAVFTAARQAIDAALACRELGDAAGLPLHLGIHAGDVVREGNNVHGGAVQVASRVQSAAAPGEILVSQTVRDLARTSAAVAFDDRGEHDLKGIDEPQRLYAVRGV